MHSADVVNAPTVLNAPTAAGDDLTDDTDDMDVRLCP